MRTVVIGGGAAGMGAAWGLTKNGHQVVLIEREERLGGHLMACDVPLPDGSTVPVDVGVSDFNRATFANVGALLDELGLEYYPICQHASFMHADGRTAWYSDDGGIHAITPFEDEARFAAEMARFRLECIEVLDDPLARDETLAEYCDRRGYSHEFRDRYLYPRSQGSFPMPDTEPAIYPVRGLVAFWRIHGLAGPGPANRNVVKGGMASYADAFGTWLEARGGEVRTGCPVVGVARRPEGVRVRYTDPSGDAREEVFEHAVFAVRGEQILPLLEDASQEEKDVFGSLRWHRARVSVHRDRGLLPDREEAWGAYNYVLCEGEVPAIRPTITFYPAKLAKLAGAEGIFVTMNPFREPDPDKVVADYFLSHPAAGSGGDLATARVAQIQGIRNCWYCGSYLVQPWVHEPALATGVDLAELMRQRIGAQDGDRLPYLDDFLASIPLFAGLDPFAIADVGLAADRFTAAAGDRLFRQDDPADGVYVVASGRLALNVRMPGDAEVELAQVGAGGLIGEFCLLDGGRRSAEAVALEPTLGYRIDLARFGALRASEKPAAIEVLDRLRLEVARRTRATVDTIGASLGEMADPRPAPAQAAPPGQVETGDCATLLQSFPGFETFSPASWRELNGLVTKVIAEKGARLETPGKPVGGLHIVARGALRAGLPVGDGVEQLLIHGPGALAGAAGLVDGGDWPLALDVREDAIVFTLDARDLAVLRTAHSPLAFKLFDLIGQQLTKDLRRISRTVGRRQSQLAELREVA